MSEVCHNKHKKWLSQVLRYYRRQSNHKSDQMYCYNSFQFLHSSLYFLHSSVTVPLQFTAVTEYALLIFQKQLVMNAAK